jgi:tetratricopeptide (TPR) repeat protein
MSANRFKPIQLFVLLSLLGCSARNNEKFQSDLKAIELKEGDIALCGSVDGKFGTVEFDISCADKVKNDFNLATALLHSFEYDEAEKVFAKVLKEDPECVMAYWGVAMSNYHTLWAAQGPLDLEKGRRTVALARSLKKTSERESDYLEAIGTFYDHSDTLDHKTRSLKFEKAMEQLHKKYPEDKEAAIFYALSLDATADPTDKTFRNQRKAGEILNRIYLSEPNHPGITHYIIHNYDYPELAEMALPAARAYAGIAPASAHAQHMPSHIFTRLGLWDESIQSNLKSISAAQCYAANLGIKGRWDEELHGMDYLTYAYLQEGRDKDSKAQADLLKSIIEASANNGKSAYVFAALPARYVLERKHWDEAAQLEANPADFPWEQFPWENAITHFARLIGFTHVNKIKDAGKELEQLESLHKKLTDSKEMYKASQVQTQILAGNALIQSALGRKTEALQLMTRAAEMEDATAKSPVTPGEVVPARELLADMLLAMGRADQALREYESDLKRHPNRFNALYGAGLAAEKSKDTKKATEYFNQLLKISDPETCERTELQYALHFVKKNI